MLKSARKIEMLVIAALLCTILVLCMGEGKVTTAANTDEKRMQSILSQIDGAGRVSVMLAEDAEGQMTGAVVVASGAENVHVMLEIQRAVRAITGLELENIEIVKSKD